jgi:hypothetical protein
VHEQFKWETFEHPAYSPDFAPSDYHMFLHPKKFFASKSLRSDQETKDVVQDWLKGLEANLFDNGMLKPAPQYDEFLNLRGNYIEK